MYWTKFSPNRTIAGTMPAVRNKRRFWSGLLVLAAAMLLAVPAAAQVNVQVTWNPNSEPDLAGYRVWWGTEAGVYPNSQEAGTATNDIIEGLSEGTTYYIAVTAYDLAENESAKSQWVSITPDLTPPTFSNINAGSITENTVTITWTTNEPSTSQVEYGQTISYGSQTPLDSNLVTNHSVQVTGLNAWTTYHYRVKSNDDDGNQGISGDNVFTTDDTTDPIISNIQVVNIGDNGATVTWETNEPATSRVDYGETTGYGQNVQDLSLKTSHSLSITGLDSNTLYHYRVRSIDEATNQAASADDTFTTTDSGAPVISNVAVSNITATSATITWTTDEPATSVVHYGVSAGYGADASVGGMSTSHSVTLTGLEDDTTYHFQVESTDEATNTATSNDDTFDTIDETAPAAPTGVDVEVVSE